MIRYHSFMLCLMRHMKTAVVLCALWAAAAVWLTACTNEDQAGDKLSAADVSAAIRQAVKLDELREGDLAKLNKLYHLDAGDVDSFMLLTSLSNVRADEVAVIKVKDPARIEAVKAAAARRIEEQIPKFRDYVPEQYQLLERHVIAEKGRFLLLAVSGEADEIERAFFEALK
ncbi:DUF4358 domain-containing protein [Paenibacillus doosanensis]|uniref:DUF4358 domain-containing protein n=1 Tax=Paenibacillus doosanensis TaxID=1229154 RepID=UPI0021805713|nr:DUF4358 domain-containing protein [Paenibacillus doosanensis]MCS7459639.1 DUF4358 domain-containing protein [Paenibacillus doosanensis]